VVFKTVWDKIPLAICSYLDQYFLVFRGNFVSCINLVFLPFILLSHSLFPHKKSTYVYSLFINYYFLVIQFHVRGSENRIVFLDKEKVRVTRHNTGRTCSMIRSLTDSRIAVDNNSDDIVFFHWMRWVLERNSVLVICLSCVVTSSKKELRCHHSYYQPKF